MSTTTDLTAIETRIKQIICGDWTASASRATGILTEEFVIIPRADLPMVGIRDDGSLLAKDSNCVHYPDSDWDADRHRADAYARLALAEALDAGILVNAARDKRRDELADEFTAVNRYSGQLPYTQKLIDRIVELEATK
ncbi:hypothetical protein QFZ79_002914 [Arthrobacter sp. V4I6]|uniref:hypothetical protein n=1 Tax=Arthrobacter sp. V4I6 TaxID=3042281 RepID=UPI002780A92E|nr:hypothetical protein [Arthrobacter sp. V4I6]MDQ0854803.1 hypothetical protein [Arthrobacter sp. V4I6]